MYAIFQLGNRFNSPPGSAIIAALDSNFGGLMCRRALFENDMIDGYRLRTSHAKKEVPAVVRAAAPAAASILKGMCGAIAIVIFCIAGGKRYPGLFLTVIQESQAVDVPGPPTFRLRRVDAPLQGVVKFFGTVEYHLFTIVGI